MGWILYCLRMSPLRCILHTFLLPSHHHYCRNWTTSTLLISNSHSERRPPFFIIRIQSWIFKSTASKASCGSHDTSISHPCNECRHPTLTMTLYLIILGPDGMERGLSRSSRPVLIGISIFNLLLPNVMHLMRRACPRLLHLRKIQCNL